MTTGCWSIPVVFINTVTAQLVKEEGYATKASRGRPLKGVGNRQLNGYVETRDFAIGSAHGKDYIFYVDTFDNLFADGTLAPETLANYDVDFDFGHDKLNLIQPAHCPNGPVYWTKAPAAIVPMEIVDRTHIRIPVTIDGKEIMATLDTSSTISTAVTVRAAARFLGVGNQSAELQPLDAISPDQRSACPGLCLSLPGRDAWRHGGRPPADIQVSASDSLWDQDDLHAGHGCHAAAVPSLHRL